MAIVVEDGTGKEDAVSYASVADADSYHAARGNTTWSSATTDAKEKALVKATDYIEQRFSQRFVGNRNTQEQALSWPRTDGTDRNGFALASDAVPLSVVRACCEYAVRALDTVLTPDVTAGTSGSVKRTRVKAGPVEEETEYTDGGAIQTVMPAFPAADRLLIFVLKFSGGVLR